MLIECLNALRIAFRRSFVNDPVSPTLEQLSIALEVANTLELAIPAEAVCGTVRHPTVMQSQGTIELFDAVWAHKKRILLSR